MRKLLQLSTLIGMSLFGCFYGDNGGGSPMENLEGIWYGRGLMSVTDGGQAVYGRTELELRLRDQGDGNYLATYFVRSFDLGYREDKEEMWTYDNGILYFPNGSATEVKDEKIVFNRTWQKNGATVQPDITLRLRSTL